MSSGIVTWFNPTKGFGGIVPESGGNDVSAFVSAVKHAEIFAVNESGRNEQEPAKGRNSKSSAKDLILVS